MTALFWSVVGVFNYVVLAYFVLLNAVYLGTSLFAFGALRRHALRMKSLDLTELIGAFIGRGHWYLMPLVTVLLTIGSLLVVAASSPLVAPFIYTLF